MLELVSEMAARRARATFTRWLGVASMSVTTAVGCGSPARLHAARPAGPSHDACSSVRPEACPAACDGGDGSACYRLAVAIRDERAPRARYGMLEGRLKQAANAEIPEAYLALARLYATGLSVTDASLSTESVAPDLALATSFARMGCDRKLGASCYQEALLLEGGAPPDLPRARIAYEAAAARGEPMGMAAIARSDAAVSHPISAPTIQCPDMFAGTWYAQVHPTTRNQWYEFRLYTTRGKGDALRGEIWADYWSGPVVGAIDRRHVVMIASGEASASAGGKATFDGNEFRGTRDDYVLDRFHGVLTTNLFLADDLDGNGLRFPGIGLIPFVRVACASDPPPSPAPR